jgi:hypothetical protein
MHNHLVNHHKHHDLKSDNTLHVIGVISNYVRWQSRYRLFRKWEKAMLQTHGVKLYVVEAAYGDRHYEVTEKDNPHHLQLRTNSEIWIKENMINLGVRYLLPRNWKYMAWIDCDVFFDDPNWAQETMHQLQHFMVIQPWQTCLDTGVNGQGTQLFKSFGYQHQRRIRKQKYSTEPYEFGHTGFAWACRREFWENCRGLLDFAILGSADHHMGWGMIGEIAGTANSKISKEYKTRCIDWQTDAVQITKNEIGFTPGNIKHSFHGPKKKRYYQSRWQILIKHHFNPDKDLRYDNRGVMQLVGKPALEQDIKLYNRSRMEDSIDEY